MKSLINHTIKIISFLLLVNIAVFCQQDSIQSNAQRTDTAFVMTKSPWGAVLRSAVLPGWGQIYNESYWKAPLIWALSGWLIYNWVQNNNLYWDYSEQYSNSQDPNDLRYRDFYRDQRDLFVIYMGITYLLNLVDAYVDAHLFDFTVEENFLNRQPMFGVKFKF